MASSTASSLQVPILRGPTRRPAGASSERRPAAWLPLRRRAAAGVHATAHSSSSSSSSSLPAAPPADLRTAASLAVTPAGAAVATAAAVLLLGAASPALALDIRMEPSNALSLPTWAVHTSSVLEWVTAMGLMWRYGEVSGNPRWKGMAWGMLPCLGSAMCACTWHFFYNSPDLQFLVALQALLTVVGNFTCWWAAYRIYEWAQQKQEA